MASVRILSTYSFLAWSIIFCFSFFDAGFLAAIGILSTVDLALQSWQRVQLSDNSIARGAAEYLVVV